MVRVPGSPGNSGFHRESNQDDVEIKLEPGIDAPAVSGSPQTQLREEEGSTKGQSTGRSSGRVKEEGLATDLEDKPLPPPQPLFGEGRVVMSSRKKLKAPGSDAGDRGDAVTIAEDQLEDAMYRNDLAVFMKEAPVMKIVRPKLIGSALLGPVTTPPTMNNKLDPAKTMLHLLKEAGYAPRAFDAHELFDLELKTIVISLQNFFDKLAPCNAPSAESHIQGRAIIEQNHCGLNPRPGSPKSYAHLLRRRDGSFLEGTTYHGNAIGNNSSQSTGNARRGHGIGRTRHDQLDEFDPDDLSIDIPRRAAVASAETSTNSGVVAPRIRVSAISELKAFSGKDNVEDRARSWQDKVKSAFIRDQAPDSEKFLVFGDLLTGPARNWYRQLSRSTRSNWKSLLEGFLTQYGGRGVSVARQYYHARKRSDESPLEYLHRLNVAGMRAKLPIKDGSAAARREHVEHFIETLDDRELAGQLALLRLSDAEVLEDTCVRVNEPDLDKAEPQWDPRSELCIFAYIEKRPGEEVNRPTDAIDNTCELKPTSALARLRRIDEFSRSETMMELDLLPGELCGYWKYHAPGKWFKQAKAVGRINNESATLLFDSGAEVSIIDTAFARKVDARQRGAQR
ncbi:unnamed protein product [Phytophthora fragariaefolia]|uniref:Unnamed protein product n=1 Tax=Phytophthora fragariaefolia TaxID=1490495 RepID=A0A9W6XHH1_9STRA|nr:unnamed protein product [Phytophthora fragariaefolia]